MSCVPPFYNQKGLDVCYCLWGCHPDPSLGPILPGQDPSQIRRGPVQIRHVLCSAAFRTHPGPEVGAIPLGRAWTGRNRLLKGRAKGDRPN